MPRYGLGNYYDENSTVSLTGEEAKIIKNLSFAGKRLMGFCRTNLFKRLESSGYSFLLSLSRHILRNYIFIYACENNKPLPIGKNISNNLDDYLEDADTDDDENYLQLILTAEKYQEQAKKVYNVYASKDYKHRFDWIRHEVFADFRKTITQKDRKETITMSLIQDLKNDSAELLKALIIGKGWNPEDDRQLNALQSLLTQTHSKEKVLVFTQFTEIQTDALPTLKARGIAKLECVTGSHDDPTAMAERFSPVSNEKPHINQTNQDLRVLIATDVLSEGQNLQDAHIIVNYDLPWAIIRLIQRAGRVNRIGPKSRHDSLLLFSAGRKKELKISLKLRDRLRNRISQNAEVVGSDETFFDGDPVNITDLYNEKSGILDESEQETETDLTSFAYQIWKNAIDADPSLKKQIKENMPNVVYATKDATEITSKNGVIAYARTQQDNDVLTWIDSDRKIVTQSQHTILKSSPMFG